MKPAPFDYMRPRSLSEAVAALSGEDWGTRVLAGGQSLVPMLNLRLASVTRIVDIVRIDELRRATETADAVVLGACVRHGEIEDGLVPDPSNGMMRHVAGRLAYRAIRNRGTIGGSLALADPSADWLTVVRALGATFRVTGPAGERTVASDEMIVGPYATALEPHDILTSIVIPKLSSNARWGFHKVIRKAGEYPVTTASVVIEPARGQSTAVLGGNDRGPLRMTGTATVLKSAGAWSDDIEERLRRAIRADIAAAGRGEDFYQTKLAETTVLRAAAMAVGR